MKEKAYFCLSLPYLALFWRILFIFANQTFAQMSNRKQDIAYFVSFCVEQYKSAKGLSGEEAMNVLNRYGVLEYLEECYEPLHTQGKQWLLEEIDEFINIRKGA